MANKSPKQLAKKLLTANSFDQKRFDEGILQLTSEWGREQFLYHLFTSREKSTPHIREMLLRDIADSFPSDLIIKMVRRSLAFLREEWANLLQQIPLPESLKYHQEGWFHIRDHEEKLWTQVLEAYAPVDASVDAATLIANFTVAADMDQLIGADDKRILHVASIFGLLVQLFFQKERALTKAALEVAVKQTREAINPLCLALIHSLDEYLSYYDTTVQIYAYDDNFGVLPNGELGYLDEKKIALWKQDGQRPILIEKLFLRDARSRLGDQATPFKVEREALSELVAATSCDVLYSRGKYASTLAIGTVLQTLSREVNSFGCGMITLQEFNAFFTKAGNKDYPAGKVAAETFIYEPKPINFNRFGWRYDAMRQPFVRINNLIFYCATFIHYNSWMFSITDAAIRSYRSGRSGSKERAEAVFAGKQSALLMEKLLQSVLVQHGYTAIVPKAGAFREHGDVDLIVSDGNADLLIQLKRTKVRVTLREAYEESANSDHKATTQLQKAIPFLQRKNTVHQLKPDFRSWVVSTSFEHLGELADGITKINYYELLQTLRLLAPGADLSSFCSAVEDDHLMKYLTRTK